jgi:probable addiction module antidote protein
MRKMVSHKSWMKKYLADREEAAAYLNCVAEDGDLPFFLNALRTVVGAQGGMGALAKATKMSRTTLYKTLSPKGNPGMATLETILAVYGIRIGFFPIKETSGRPRHAPRAQHGQAHYPAP